MSWVAGADIFDSIIMSVSRNVPDYDTRVDIYYDLIPLFELHECHNLEQCRGMDPAFDCIVYTNTFINEFKLLTGATEDDAGVMAHACWFSSEDKNPHEDATKEAMSWTGRPPLEHPGFEEDDDEWPNY